MPFVNRPDLPGPPGRTDLPGLVLTSPGMFTIVLALHSWIRWIALVSTVGVAFAAFRGKVVGPSSVADRWAMASMMALDIQLLLGLVLYLGLSPNMREILNHFGESMRRADLRFYAVEHISAMAAAVILSHVGRVLARRAATPAAKRRRLLVTFGLATVLIIIGIPWPGRPGGRPLFRYGSNNTVGAVLIVGR